jgi:SprT protein
MKSLRVSPEIRAAFEAKIDECLAKVQLYNNITIKRPILIFRHCGRRAGVCCLRFHQWYVVINVDLVNKSATYDEQLNCTLPHEVAHAISFTIFGHDISPHGYEWRKIMRWLDVNPERCHDMDMTGVKVRRQQRFGYTCGCHGKVYHLTTVKHNQHQRGLYFVCNLCKTRLTYAGIAVDKETLMKPKPIEVPRTREVKPVVTNVVRPPSGPQYRNVTRFVNGSLVNERILIEPTASVDKP